MNRNNDEELADVVIKVLDMENGMRKFFEDFERRMAKAEARMDKADARNELTLKRMVKAETRMEAFDRKLDISIQNLIEMGNNFKEMGRNVEEMSRNIEEMGRRLDKSTQSQEAFIRMQSKVNRYFLNAIKRNGYK